MNKNAKILYVDDEPINLQLFKINFKNDYTVLTAESGYEGLELLKINPDVHLVISDMKMPGMNGIEFIKKAKEEFPNVLFYILTGFEITPEIQDSLNTGLILKYFRKPFNTKEIVSSIAESVKLL